MAREYGRIYVNIWDDPDFTALRSDDQRAYFVLLTSRRLSWCGVMTFVPAHFDALADDTTTAKIKASVKRLAASRFVVVDDRTQELLVRSYVRHEGVLDRLNMGKATGSAFEAVVSSDIKRAIGDELSRVMKERPELPGWEGLAATSPTAHAMACGMEWSMG